jgi:D-glycero-alpha-D-manno-heptose-7-phosphate kinase
VALVAALLGARSESLPREDIAHVAWQVEVEDAGLAGGKQDQYLAALGGFRVLTFTDPKVETEALALDDDFTRHLEAHLLLCYTGTSRVSANTIARVMGGYVRGDSTIAGALHGLKETALRMRDALRFGDLALVGKLLSENWRCQRDLDPMMETDDMARLGSAMAGAGVLGGKAAGSGAGGCMFFIAPDMARAREAAEKAGARIFPVTLVKEGVRSW